MAKALYRKYRPRSLSEVVGQEQIIKTLNNSLKAGKISHAYLFVGPRGCGKTSVARIIAHMVNDFDYEIEDDYVDIIEIDGASNRGIDNIRELREKVAIAPTMGKYKVYIIDEVHMLTKEAFNALLKTLEEPPKHAIFIMATTDIYKVPITITSRAQTYTFKLASNEIMFNFLSEVIKKENILISDDALNIIVRRGGGSFRDSLSLLDQISNLSDDQITKDMVVTAMGLPQDEKIRELLDAHVMGDIRKITTIVKELLSSGIKAETLAEEMIATIIDEPEPDFLPLLAKLPNVKAPFAEAKLIVAISQDLPDKSFSKANHTFSESDTKVPTKPPISQTNLSNPKSTSKDQGLQNSLKGTVLTTDTTKMINFSWEGFLRKVRDLNEAIYAQLLKTKYDFIGDVLNIYPEKRIVKTILSRDNNKRILTDAVDSNIKIVIHDIDESPKNKVKDEVLDKISVIMGGKVQNDGGTNPFEK